MTLTGNARSLDCDIPYPLLGMRVDITKTISYDRYITISDSNLFRKSCGYFPIRIWILKKKSETVKVNRYIFLEMKRALLLQFQKVYILVANVSKLYLLEGADHL